MPDLGGGLRGCYRCGYVWRPLTGKTPRLCARCKSQHWEAPIIRPLRLGKHSGPRKALGRHRDAIIELSHQRGFENVRLFGSVRRDEATASSDIDFLVAPSDHGSILSQIALRQDLERLLRKRVDVVTDEQLHWLFRTQVLFEAMSV